MGITVMVFVVIELFNVSPGCKYFVIATVKGLTNIRNHDTAARDFLIERNIDTWVKCMPTFTSDINVEKYN